MPATGALELDDYTSSDLVAIFCECMRVIKYQNIRLFRVG